MLHGVAFMLFVCLLSYCTVCMICVFWKPFNGCCAVVRCSYPRQYMYAGVCVPAVSHTKQDY